MRESRLSYGDDIVMREYNGETTRRRERLASEYLRYRTKEGVTLEAEKEGSMIMKLRQGGYPSSEDACACLREGSDINRKVREATDELIRKEVSYLERRDA